MANLKRYLLFGGEDYYPRGGWEDFIASYSDLDSAIGAGLREHNHNQSWFHVIDSCTGDRVS